MFYDESTIEIKEMLKTKADDITLKEGLKGLANIATGDIVIKLNNNDNKSILEIGNIKIYNTKKFNWLNRLMFRLFFGIKITNIK